MADKNSFIMFVDYKEKFKKLSDEQMGKLIRAVFEYEETGMEPDMDDIIVNMAFDVIKIDLDKNHAKYEEIVEKRKEAGRKGGKRKQTQANEANAKFAKQTQANQADNDNDSVSDNDNDSVNNNNNICGADAPSAVVDKSDSTHDVEDESDKVPYKEIIDYLNQKLGTHYLPKSKDSRKAIHARWAEGYRLEDFKTVIDNMFERWGKDAKMADYLRPITLFSPKFESYLNLKPVAEAKPANQFHNFEQRDEIDFDDLEAQLDSQLARDLGGMP